MQNLIRGKQILCKGYRKGLFEPVNYGSSDTVRNLSDRVVIIGGIRTPFSKIFKHYIEFNLESLAMETTRCLWRKFELENNFVEYAIYGNALQKASTSNIAIEAMQGSTSEYIVPSHSVNTLCISSLLSATQATDMIKAKINLAVIAGGVESSTQKIIPPNRKIYRSKASLSDKFHPFFEYRIFDKPLYINKDFSSRIPRLKDFKTGRTMLDECEIMCHYYAVSREEMDQYSYLSHMRAGKARDDGLLNDVVSISNPKNQILNSDDSIRNSSLESLSALPGVSKILTYGQNSFITALADTLKINKYKSNLLTAGNSCFPADGGALLLISSETKALDYGYTPKAIIKSYEISCHHPEKHFLLGTAYSVARLLSKNKLRFEDIGVWEVHEPFAGHVLTVLKCLNSPEFLKDDAKISSELGQLYPEDINHWGGTLAFGHPLGATGGRLLTMAVERLNHDNKKYAVVCGCAPGSMGMAILLENYSSE